MNGQEMQCECTDYTRTICAVTVDARIDQWCTSKVMCTRDNGFCRCGTRCHIRHTWDFAARSGRRVKILVWNLCHGNARGNTYFQVISV